MLCGTRNTILYHLSAYATTWEAIDTTRSASVKVLTYADNEMSAWQAGTLDRLAVPARYGGIVLARARVDVPIEATVPFRAWACTHLSKLLFAVIGERAPYGCSRF